LEEDMKLMMRNQVMDKLATVLKRVKKEWNKRMIGEKEVELEGEWRVMISLKDDQKEGQDVLKEMGSKATKEGESREW
jgi:hypothetical protein